MSATTATTNVTDPNAPSDAAFCERIAGILGNPLPADWKDPAAIARRQDVLADAARVAGAAALELAVVHVETNGDTTAPAHVEASEVFTQAVIGMLDAQREYVRSSQRSDARPILRAALTDTCGEVLASMVTDALERLIALVRETALAESPGEVSLSGRAHGPHAPVALRLGWCLPPPTFGPPAPVTGTAT